MPIESFVATPGGWRSFWNQRIVPFPSDDSGYIPGWGLPSWEDHFEGSSLNPAVWNIRNGYQEAQDVSTMRAANVIVEDSCVKLRVKKETYNGRDYTSGYIDTIGKWWRKYGRFEIRAKLPVDPGVSRGLWPAFWLRDQTGTGEIDVLETIGTPNNHPEVYPTGGGYWSSSFYKTTGVKTTGNPYWTQVFQQPKVDDGEFHTWAFEWKPTGLSLFCDGFLMKSFSPSEWSQFEPGFPTGVNFRIDVFVGSNWQGWPNDTDTILPRDMTIDYVRYWELPS